MSHTAAELAKFLGADLDGDAAVVIAGVASPANATERDLIYLDAPKHLNAVEVSRAKCVLLRRGVRVAGRTNLSVADPKLAFAKAAAWLRPAKESKPGVHHTAIIAPTAKIDPEAIIGPYVVIEEDVHIGAGSEVSAFCYIGERASIGEDCRLHPRVTLYAGARLGNGVEVHSGVVIGADGFGYVYSGAEGHIKFPQIGGVEIGDGVEIGANTTIDRGSLDTTLIARGVKIDNLVQVAHNVLIGEHSIVAAQTGISGSSKLGNRVIVGGQVGIGDHCELEDGSIAGSQAGIPTGKTIRAGDVVWGTPARPLKRFKEQYAWFSRLPELARRLKRLEGKPGEGAS
jgi:UDP-3-O-[3-hydroxymyristoyl] glucosamine N-acyltransferase